MMDTMLPPDLSDLLRTDTLSSEVRDGVEIEGSSDRIEILKKGDQSWVSLLRIRKS